MAMECELLEQCGFFKKYQSGRAAACMSFISQYCKGPKLEQCKRKEYRKQNGAPPPDNMLPSGQMFSG